MHGELNTGIWFRKMCRIESCVNLRKENGVMKSFQDGKAACQGHRGEPSNVEILQKLPGKT